MVLGGLTTMYIQSKFVDFSVPVFYIEGFWGHRFPVPKRDYIKVGTSETTRLFNKYATYHY